MVGGRQADAGRTAAAASHVRFHGVQHLPAANGGGQRQAHAAPGPIPGSRLWASARGCRTAATANTGISVTMTITVHLFARAKDLAGAGSVPIDLPAGAPVGGLKRRLGEEWPRLARILERSALAVGDECVDDTAELRPDSEVALLPPV